MSRRRLLAAVGATALGGSLGGVAMARLQKSPGESASTSGSRWGLAIDLQRCAERDGCQVCIEACHHRHRIAPSDDPRHEITWIGKARFERVFPDATDPWMADHRRETPVVVLCNHCQNAPCTRVCPTRATWRRNDGVVAMDTHRCIGCRYCMAACPYGARSFNWKSPPQSDPTEPYPARKMGVAEKCTLCAERLDIGRSPWCIEACQQRGASALVFGDLSDPDSEVRRVLAKRPALRRRPTLGTEPSVYYLV